MSVAQPKLFVPSNESGKSRIHLTQQEMIVLTFVGRPACFQNAQEKVKQTELGTRHNSPAFSPSTNCFVYDTRHVLKPNSYCMTYELVRLTPQLPYGHVELLTYMVLWFKHQALQNTQQHYCQHGVLSTNFSQCSCVWMQGWKTDSRPQNTMKNIFLCQQHHLPRVLVKSVQRW